MIFYRAYESYRLLSWSFFIYDSLPKFPFKLTVFLLQCNRMIKRVKGILMMTTL